MARSKAFDEDSVLEAAMRLFWQKGFEATSIQGLEDATGLTRTSLYNAYGDKRSLFRFVLTRYMETKLARLLFPLTEAKTTHAAIEAVLKETIKLNFARPNPGGCLVILSKLESEQHDKATNELLDKTLQHMADVVAKRVDQGKSDGELDSSLSSTLIGNQVTALVMGITVMCKAGFPKKVLQNVAATSPTTLLRCPMIDAM